MTTERIKDLPSATLALTDRIPLESIADDVTRKTTPTAIFNLLIANAATWAASASQPGILTDTDQQIGGQKEMVDGILTGGVADAEYDAAQVIDFDAGETQALVLTGDVTSMETDNRTPGRKCTVLVTSEPDGTFTRATAATDPYTGAGVASGVPRFVQPPVNLTTYSEDLIRNVLGYFGTTRIQKTADVIEGTTIPLYRLIEGVGSGEYYASFSYSRLAIGDPCCIAFYARKETQRYAWCNNSDGLGGVTWFDLETGTVGTVGTGYTAGVEAVGGGVYRCWAAISTLTALGPIVGLSDTDGATTFTGAGKSIQIGGLMVTKTMEPLIYSPNGTDRPDQGLMVEEGATNLLAANQSQGAGGWSSGGFTNPVTLTFSDTTHAWTGGSSLKVSCDGTLSLQGAYNDGIAGTANLPYAGTVRVWAPAGAIMKALLNDGVNSINGAVVNFTGTGDWLDIDLTITLGASDTTNLRCVVLTDAAQAIDFWIDGALIRQAAYSCSFIDGGSARDDEKTTVPLTSVTSGALIAKVYIRGEATGTSAGAHNHYIFDHRGAANADLIALLRNTTGQWTFYTGTSAGSFDNIAAFANLQEGWHIFSAAWESGRRVMHIDSDLAANDVPVKLPSVVRDDLTVGCVGSGGDNLNGFVAWVARFNSAPSNAALAAYGNIHDPSLAQRLNEDADYFVDYSAIPASQGGNRAPARALTLNPGWAVMTRDGQRPTKLHSGKRARLRLECAGTTERDVIASWDEEAS